MVSADMTPNGDVRVLVTGASGYIGLHCVQQLLDQGYTVRGTVRDAKNEKKVAPMKALDKNRRLELVEADLCKPDGWTEAVTDVSLVLHVASPFPPLGTVDDRVITTAVDGVLHVFKACASTDSIVRRVVLTSSVIAITEGHKYDVEKVFTEDDWTDVSGSIASYDKSKVLAERAAWDFVRDNGGHRFELAVVNPAFVVGPLLSNVEGTSAMVIKQLLTGDFPAVPHVHMPVIDVRDVAKAHLAAMTAADAAGHRHILAVQPSYWFTDMAAHLASQFKPYGYAVVTRQVPKCVIWFLSLFMKDAKAVYPKIDKLMKLDNSRMKNVLGITQPIKQEESVVEMAHSLVQHGLVDRKPAYTSPS